MGPTSGACAGHHSALFLPVPVLSHSVWEKLENRSGENFKEGRWEGAQGRPWLIVHLQGPSVEASVESDEGLCPSHIPDGRRPPLLRFFFPLREGKGGEAPASSSSGVIALLTQARDGAPPSAFGSTFDTYPGTPGDI